MKRELLVAGILVLCLALSAAALHSYPPPRITAQITRVIDGDTVELQIESIENITVENLSEGELVKVRYIGANTPETVHPFMPVEEFGREASRLNTSLVSGKQVFLELDVEHWDPFGRLLAYVYLDKEGYAMVNAVLVGAGFAYSSPYPPNVRYESVFRTLTATARELNLGLWCPEEGENNEITFSLFLSLVESGEILTVTIEDGHGRGTTVDGEEFFVQLPDDPEQYEALLQEHGVLVLVPPCNCSGPDLDCDDFVPPEEAQRCYEYCKDYGDVFALDRDNDGIACE